MRLGRYLLLAGGAVALLACQNTTGTAPVQSGGSAGAMGEAYCEAPPANPDDMANWNRLCNDQGRL
jgi:hypothetical protein